MTAALAIVASAVLLGAYVIAESTPHKAGSMVLLTVGTQGKCSGVHIGDGKLLTAAHCDSGNITVTTDKGYTFDTPATRLAVSKEYDVALFTIPGLEGSVKAAALSCAPMFVGQDLHIAGHPLILEWINVWGRVAAMPKGPQGHWQEAVVVDVAVAGGNSGGPAYDMSGRVRGIVVGVLSLRVSMFAEVPLHYGIVVPSSAICRLLGRAN